MDLQFLFYIVLPISVVIVFNAFMICRVIQNLNLAGSLGSRIGSYLGGYGILPFVWPLSTMVGFVEGQEIGGVIVLGEFDIHTGVVVSIFVVMIFVCFVGTLFGCLLGALLQRLIQSITGLHKK